MAQQYSGTGAALPGAMGRSSPLLAAVLVVGGGLLAYLLVQAFGFEFLLENGTLLVGGLLFVLAVRLKAWWPAALLLAQVPFQGVLTTKFGLWGNLLSIGLVLAFFTKFSPLGIFRLLFATRAQLIVAIGLGFVAASALWGKHDFSTTISAMQKLTLVAIVSVIAYAIYKGHIVRLAWVTVISTTLMFGLSIVEFYYGEEVIPFLSRGNVGIEELISQGISPAEIGYRLFGVGFSAGSNRMAFMAILPLGLSFALANVSKGMISRTVVLICMTILLIGVLLTGSRTGAIGVAMVSLTLVLFPLGKRTRRHVALAAIIVAFALMWWVWVSFPLRGSALTRTLSTIRPGADVELSIGRDRIQVWRLSFELFSLYPALGAGLGSFREYVELVDPILPISNPHSTIGTLLAETGIAGTALNLILIAYFVSQFIYTKRIIQDIYKPWHLSMFSAFLSMSALLPVSSYYFDRFFWVPVAFIVAMEARYAKPRRSLARKTEA